MRSSNKDARINIKLASQDKTTIEQAAVIGGFRSTTDYMMKVLLEDSKKRIEVSKQLIENEQDAALFYEILNRPAQVNNKLSASAAKYKKLFSK
jgi:uncharacterized protein (DUF1778 family)